MIDDFLQWIERHLDAYCCPAEEQGMLDHAVMVMNREWKLLVVVFTDEERSMRAGNQAVYRASQHPWVKANPDQMVYVGRFECQEA